MTTAQRPVGELLRQWRERRRLSQLELAIQAEVSTRHLSFVETGRARPSRDMVLHLAEELDLPLRERNRLLLAAGYAPVYPERPLDSAGLAAVRTAVRQVLTGHEPGAGRLGAPVELLRDHLGQRPERLAPVADRVLLLRRELGVGMRLPASLEDRVVAEACRTAGRAYQATGLAPGPDVLPAVGQDQGGRADERGAQVLVGDVGQLVEQQLVVCRVAGAPARPAGAEHTRCAAQRVDGDPRVVGHGRQPGAVRPGTGLEQRVLLEGEAGFAYLRIGRYVVQADQRHRAPAQRGVENALQLNELLGVTGGQQHPGTHGASAICWCSASSTQPAPPRSPTLTAETERCSASAGSPASALCAASHATASCSATYAPVTAAVRVPPSACSTSQSSTIEFSPSAFRLRHARRLRPIRREISWVRPPMRPFTLSRSLRVVVARGSIAYSAVTQPRPEPFRQRGTPSVTLAVHSTLVLPNSTSTEPSGCMLQCRGRVIGRSCSGARPSGRAIRTLYAAAGERQISYRQPGRTTSTGPLNVLAAASRVSASLPHAEIRWVSSKRPTPALVACSPASRPVRCRSGGLSSPSR